MTFNSNADVSGSGAKRRGPGGGVIAGGVGGLGAIAVILLQIFTGGDFSSLLGGGGGLQAGPGTESEIQNCETGADANASVDCRLAAGSKIVNQYWATQVQGYRQPQLIIVDGSTPTSCGTASNATLIGRSVSATDGSSAVVRAVSVTCGVWSAQYWKTRIAIIPVRARRSSKLTSAIEGPASMAT